MGTVASDRVVSRTMRVRKSFCRWTTIAVRRELLQRQTERVGSLAHQLAFALHVAQAVVDEGDDQLQPQLGAAGRRQLHHAEGIGAARDGEQHPRARGDQPFQGQARSLGGNRHLPSFRPGIALQQAWAFDLPAQRHGRGPAPAVQRYP